VCLPRGCGVLSCMQPGSMATRGASPCLLQPEFRSIDECGANHPFWRPRCFAFCFFTACPLTSVYRFQAGNLVIDPRAANIVMEWPLAKQLRVLTLPYNLNHHKSRCGKSDGLFIRLYSARVLDWNQRYAHGAYGHKTVQGATVLNR